MHPAQTVSYALLNMVTHFLWAILKCMEKHRIFVHKITKQKQVNKDKGKRVRKLRVESNWKFNYLTHKLFCSTIVILLSFANKWATIYPTNKLCFRFSSLCALLFVISSQKSMRGFIPSKEVDQRQANNMLLVREWVPLDTPFLRLSLISKLKI